MQLAEWFDDLAARFLLNLPYSETSSLPRFCFQIEEAQWFYEDFIRPMAAAAGQHLPNLPLRHFSLLMFQHCPLWNEYSAADLATAYDLFLEYKVRVPVRGAILLDQSMEKVVLVKGYKKGANWSFPRGKINIDEDDLDCAIREVYEETGYDIRGAGLVPQPKSSAKYIDITMREQHMRMFVFRGVPLDTHFEPQTRKEISKVEFYTLRDLPGYRKKHKDAEHDPSHDVHQANKFYMVAPFLGPLKKWIGQQRQTSGYVSTDANQYDTITMPGEDTDDGLAFNIPQVSNEEKSEALKKLLSIGAFAQTDLPQTVLQTAAYNDAAAHHSAYVSNQPGLPAAYSNQPQVAANNAQKNALLQIFQGGRQPAQAQMNQHPVAPTQLDRNRFPVQSYLPATTITHPQHAFHGMSQQPVELPATSLTPTTNSWQTGLQSQAGHNQFPPPQARELNSAAGAPSSISPRVAELAPPKRMLLQLLSAPNAAAASAGERSISHPPPSSEHASKLLGLFTSPQAVSGPANPSAPVELPPDNAIEHHQISAPPAAKRPAEVQQRKSTINEFTRTLPIKVKKVDSTKQAGKTSDTFDQQNSSARTSKQKSDGSIGQRKDVARQQSQATVQEPVKINPKARQIETPQAPRHAAAADSSTPASRSGRSAAKQKQKPTKTENAAPPTFTILTRPDSRKESSQSDGVQQSSAVSSSDQNGSLKASTPVVQPEDKLLALFGSKPKHSLPPPSKQPARTVVTDKAEQQDNLLKLFAKPSVQQATAEPAAPTVSVQKESSEQDAPNAVPTTSIPQAPTFQPEQRPTKLDTSSSNTLLDLFKKPTSKEQATPISPFMLGSPETLRRPQPSIEETAQPVAQHNPARETKQNSVSTPAESRGFLLDYLNGVVQKEGNRG